MTNQTPRGARLRRLIPSRRRVAAATVLFAAGAVLLSPTAATADTVPLQGSVTGTATLTVPDVAKASNCTNVITGGAGTKVPFTISINADDDYSYVWYDLYVLDSDGDTVDATDIAFTTDETTSGTYTGTLCTTLPAGSYTAAGLVCFDALEAACEDATTPTVVTDTYRITAPAHHYTVSASRSGTTLTGTVRDNGHAVAGARVSIQRMSGTRWVLAFQKTTNAVGQVTAAGSYGSTYRITYGSAVSAAVGVPKAGSKLTATRAKYGKHAWKITGTLSGPVHSGRRVHLQRLTGSGWRNTTKSCVTAGNGRCSVSFTQNSRHNNHLWYRLWFNTTTEKSAAASGRFHITHR